MKNIKWKRCIICQLPGNKELRCPLNSAATEDKLPYYQRFMNRLYMLREKGVPPPVAIQFDIDEMTAQQMMDNRARWHRICKNKFADEKITALIARKERREREAIEGIAIVDVKEPIPTEPEKLGLENILPEKLRELRAAPNYRPPPLNLITSTKPRPKKKVKALSKLKRLALEQKKLGAKWKELAIKKKLAPEARLEPRVVLTPIATPRDSKSGSVRESDHTHESDTFEDYPVDDLQFSQNVTPMHHGIPQRDSLLAARDDPRARILKKLGISQNSIFSSRTTSQNETYYQDSSCAGDDLEDGMEASASEDDRESCHLAEEEGKPIVEGEFPHDFPQVVFESPPKNLAFSASTTKTDHLNHLPPSPY